MTDLNAVTNNGPLPRAEVAAGAVQDKTALPDSTQRAEAEGVEGIVSDVVSGVVAVEPPAKEREDLLVRRAVVGVADRDGGLAASVDVAGGGGGHDSGSSDNGVAGYPVQFTVATGEAPPMYDPWQQVVAAQASTAPFVGGPCPDQMQCVHSKRFVSGPATCARCHFRHTVNAGHRQQKENA